MKRVHYAIIVVAVVALLAGTATAYYWPQFLLRQSAPETRSDTANAAQTAPQEERPAIAFRCPIDDETTTAENMAHRPLAIMVENAPEARPQSGLSKACTVYETVAEGGVTRFMAVFAHSDASTVGPVRSAREYFVDLAKQYDAIYSHCGGPATIYDILKNLDVANLDEFANQDAYWRVRTRKAPHNLYTSTRKLREKAGDRGYQDQVFYQKPNFKDEDGLELRPESASIEINFSKPAYAVRYEYSRQTNTYKRFMAGKPHTDGAYGNAHIAPKNIVVQYVPVSRVANDPKGRMRVSLVGSGQAIVFQDGRVIQATWYRPTISDLTRYYDAGGTQIKFNAGQTWIELVDPSSMQVTYK